MAFTQILKMLFVLKVTASRMAPTPHPPPSVKVRIKKNQINWGPVHTVLPRILDDTMVTMLITFYSHESNFYAESGGYI